MTPSLDVLTLPTSRSHMAWGQIHRDPVTRPGTAEKLVQKCARPQGGLACGGPRGVSRAPAAGDRKCERPVLRLCIMVVPAPDGPQGV